MDPSNSGADSSRGVALRIVPNARKTEVVGAHGGAIKLKVAARAVEGKANAELLLFVARTMNCPARKVTLLAGEKSRDKIIRVEGLSGDDIRSKLLSSKG